MEGWNKLVIPIVGITVSIICLATILVPVIDDATKTHTVFINNEGYYTMEEINPSESYTMSWVKSNTTVLVINGQSYNAYQAYGAAITSIIAADNWLLRYNSINSASGYLQYYDGTNWLGDTNTKSMTIEASGGQCTITHVSGSDNVTTKNVTYTLMYAIAPNSTDDVMKKPTESPYVNAESQIYAMGITSGINGLVKIDGSIAGGLNIDVIGTDEESITNITIDSTAVSGYNNLYVINKITFDVTINGNTTNCTYSYFIVPYQITAELSNHLDNGPISILLAIPIMVVLVILMAAASMIMRNRE